MNDKLRALLHEDLDSAEEADALSQQLSTWKAPAVDQRQTTALIDRLASELQPGRKPLAQRILEWWPLLLLRSQYHVVRGEIWWASAFVMALGTVVTLLSPQQEGAYLPIAALAPVVAAVGVALLYDTDVQQVLELENATRASIRLLLLSRLTLVFGFNLLLALTASVVLSVLQSDISLWPLVLSWLAPMSFLCALAFLLSVVFVDPVAGSLFSLGVWGLHIFMKSFETSNMWLYALSMPGLSDGRVWLFGAAAVIVGVALWLVGYTERDVNLGEKA